MPRSMSASMMGCCFEMCMRHLYQCPPPMQRREDLCAELRRRADTFYRGEVWPLKHAFGFLSRYVHVICEQRGRSLTPSVVTTWVNDLGSICCSCSGRTSHAARLRVRRQDADCAHSRELGRTLSGLGSLLGVKARTLRQTLPAIYSKQEPSAGSRAASCTTASADYWDSEGHVETFRTGKTIVAVVVSGLGLCKVVAPVRCSRKSPSCAFCDTALGFSCVHALRCRIIRRGDSAAADGSSTRDYEDDDVACSHFPIPIYNCPLSVRTDVLMGQLIQTGKLFVVRAPLTCSTCTATRDPDTINIEEGEILCSTGYCAMEVISFFCAGKRCRSVCTRKGVTSALSF